MSHSYKRCYFAMGGFIVFVNYRMKNTQPLGMTYRGGCYAADTGIASKRLEAWKDRAGFRHGSFLSHRPILHCVMKKNKL